jgi:hypothetical protein
MTKARRRRSNLPKPAPFPADEDPFYEEDRRQEEVPYEEEMASSVHTFEEPIFEDEVDDDIRFVDSSATAVSDRNSDTLFDEPIFEENVTDFDESPPKAIAVGSSPIGAVVSSPQKPSAIQPPVEPEGDYHWNEADSQPLEPRRGRRLGRTSPFWLMGAGLALVFVVAIWLLFFRGNDTADRQLTPAPGLAGSAALPEAEVDGDSAIDPTAEPLPTATAVPLFTAGQSVIVANTAGAGIRLRNQPGTAGLTLAIYPEGESFTVLNPDGEYSSYPVEADGYRWYRIQIANDSDENLTGWAAGDFLAPSE